MSMQRSGSRQDSQPHSSLAINASVVLATGGGFSIGFEPQLRVDQVKDSGPALVRWIAGIAGADLAFGTAWLALFEGFGLVPSQ